MKKYSSLIALLLIMALLSSGCTTENVLSQTSEITQDVRENVTAFDLTKESSLPAYADALANSLVSNYKAKSVQYALMDNGNIILSDTAGINNVLDKNAPTVDTIYGIGSVSKMFLASSVMKLEEENKLSLDEPVTTYLPEFKMADERYKKITIRMLLNHSSGLEGSTLKNASLLDDNDTYAHDHLLSSFATQELKAEPGEYSVYCNDGFALAELVIEKITGLGFTEYVHNTFTLPLGLTKTKTPLDVFDKEAIAKTYFELSSAPIPPETLNLIGTCGMYSTAEDVCKFATIFNDKNPGILNQDSLDKMSAKEYANGMWVPEGENIFGYGLGWDTVDCFPFSHYGIKALAKNGDTLVYHSSLVVLPEKNMSAFVVTSGGSSENNEVVAINILLKTLLDKGEIKDIIPSKNYKELSSEIKPEIEQKFKEFEGYYGHSAGFQKIEIAGSKLSVANPLLPESPAILYDYIGDNTFISDDFTTKLCFVKESNGKSYIIKDTYADLPQLGSITISQFFAEKIEPEELAPEVNEQWQNRNGTSYILVDEKPTSTTYLGEPILVVSIIPEIPNYTAGYHITGKDTMVNEFQLPVLLGRDNSTVTFKTVNGIEYAHVKSNVFINSDYVSPISSEKSSIVTILDDGYNRCYTFLEESGGKTINVNMPESAAFAVYPTEGPAVHFTSVTGTNNTVLPENGYIIFMGKPGDTFDITLE